MSDYLNSSSISKGARIAGWIMSILPVLLFLFSASFKFLQPAGFAESVVEMGYTPTQMFRLGFVELGCTLLYLFPRTAVIGAILLTAYMGGAVATHFRVDQMFLMQILVGVLIWGGLYMRDTRIRALIPFTSK